MRYYAHVTAFVTLVANPFPGFTGDPGYPVDIVIDPPERQNRWITFFRVFLAIPAFILSGALSVVLFVVAFLGWFAALATGRMPTGLRNLGRTSCATSRRRTRTGSSSRTRTRTRAPRSARRRSRSPRSTSIRPSPSRRRSDESPPRRVGGRRARAGRDLGAAAWSLWQSVVPGDLDAAGRPLTGIPQETLERADRYERFFRIEFVLSELVLLAVLVVYARYGIRFAKESAAGRIGTGMLLGMIGLALVWISQVPFRLAEVWWDRRYDQTDSGYVETLFANWFELGAEFLFICFALVDRDGARRALSPPLVAPRRAGLRRPRLPLRLHLPVPDSHRAG